MASRNGQLRCGKSTQHLCLLYAVTHKPYNVLLMLLQEDEILRRAVALHEGRNWKKIGRVPNVHITVQLNCLMQ